MVEHVHLPAMITPFNNFILFLSIDVFWSIDLLVPYAIVFARHS